MESRLYPVTDVSYHTDQKAIYEFDFTQFKSSFNKIFFSHDSSLIKRNSPEYDEFWSFLLKYQQFQRRKAERNTGTTHASTSEDSVSKHLQLPTEYDNLHKVNISLVGKNLDTFLAKGRLIDSYTEPEVTPLRVTQLSHILLYYLDFLNKQKFNKLLKVKKDQENLPIFAHKQEILDTVEGNQVVVVAGDTGCGKSTQVPQYLLKHGYTHIACTQPRRLACISLSNRVAFETFNEFGSEVAYKIRFEGTKTAATRILFLTEGLLLRQMSTDTLLSQYNVIVIDEVHERHMQTDFLLGVLKCMLVQRTDLKLILMSATINIDLFSGYFDNCPVVKVPGRLYPIELEYCPIERAEISSRSERLDPSPYIKVLQKIDAKYPKNERGDVLIFLSGMQEIMTVVDAVRMYAEKSQHWIVLPLHSTLSIAEQDKVFDVPPETVRKCIVSTNIAETSVTIDGVRFIIDSGKVKEMSLDPKYKLQKLKEFWISRASAEQRKGRAGRTGPGVCFRLYSESELEEFQEYSTPEIQRVLIDSILLQLMALGLPDPRRFPFIESPTSENIENSVTFLKEHNALTADETLTPIGQMLSWLPVNVHIGKMLIMGSLFNMMSPVVSIAAVMSVQSPFTSRLHINHDAVNARKDLESEHGDPFTLLNAFDEWIQVKAEGNVTRKWCKRRGLEEQRFYEMTKLKGQFMKILQDHNLVRDESQERAYTSEDRRRLHGDRKRLRDLKREERHASRKTKLLKLNQDEVEFDDGAGDRDDYTKEKDIKDLEFRLSNDLSKLQEVSNRSRNFTLRDINLLKIIVCSGLYPQVAIADENNSFKPDADQVFHTKNKPYLVLHPTSVFTYQPEVLQPKKTSKTYDNAPPDLQGKLSNSHELLAFVTLLETNKPYIVNSLRVPALQTVTLFSSSIDTNATCTSMTAQYDFPPTSSSNAIGPLIRLICDDWLELRFIDSESGERVISGVIQLRNAWQELLALRLQDTQKKLDPSQSCPPYTSRMERHLSRKLAEFLDSDVVYAIRRLLPAELEHAYVGPQHSVKHSRKVVCGLVGDDSGKQHPIKGGIRHNDYLTFNCLHGDDVATAWGDYSLHLQKHWTCPTCQQDLLVTVMDKITHEAICRLATTDVLNDDDAPSESNPLQKSYFCAECDKQYRFTTTEILKHKKSHSGSVT